MNTVKEIQKLSTGTLVLLGFVAVLALWLLGSMFGIFNNFLSWDARHSGWGWKLLSIILLGAAVYLWYWLYNNPQPNVSGYMIATFVLLGLAVAAATGFKGTAGDIKQRVTYLDLQGRVADKELLYNCYEGFYHFNENPELKAYVDKYGELPGRNLWNAYIRSGEFPKSTAPRANEDFEWHTGAYEMKIPKSCR